MVLRKVKKKKDDLRDQFKKTRKKFEKNKSKTNSFNQNQMSYLLAAGVAHEFNNILGAVDGHAEWALSTEKMDDALESLKAIREACQRSAQVTRSLQFFAQPVEENFKQVNLYRSVETLKSELRPLLQKTNTEFENQISKSVSLYGDQARIEEILRNLFKNSLEAFLSPWNTSTATRTEKNKMGIGQRKKSLSNEFLSLDIYDNGPGIPEVYQAMLFQPFFTTKGVLKALQPEMRSDHPADPSRDFAGGSGLGLYRSKAIAIEHGGSLELQKTDSRGTTWNLKLPIK